MPLDIQVRVRRARPDDSKSVLLLARRLLHFGPPPWRDLQEMYATDHAVLSQALAAAGDDPIVYVAEMNADVAGFIHLHSLEDYYRRRRHGHVADIVVAEDAEGHGIGRHLLAEAEAWSRRLGYDWLSISVFENNTRALALYEQVGFRREIIRLVKVSP